MVGTEAVDFERCGTEPAWTKADAWMFGSAPVFPGSIFVPRAELEAGRWRADVIRPFGEPAPVEVVIRKYVEEEGSD